MQKAMAWISQCTCCTGKVQSNLFLHGHQAVFSQKVQLLEWCKTPWKKRAKYLLFHNSDAKSQKIIHRVLTSSLQSEGFSSVGVSQQICSSGSPTSLFNQAVLSSSVKQLYTYIVSKACFHMLQDLILGEIKSQPNSLSILTATNFCISLQILCDSEVDNIEQELMCFNCR